MPFDRFLNWVYSSVTAGMDTRQRQRFDIALARPAAGEVPPEWTPEAMGAAFMAAQAEFGGG